MLKRTTLLGASLCAVGLLIQCGRSNSPAGSTATSPATSAPVITAHPLGVTVAPGAVATFTVTATGNPSIKYPWRVGGVAIPGATAAAYSTAAVTPADNGTSYTVAVSNVWTLRVRDSATGNMTETSSTFTP